MKVLLYFEGENIIKKSGIGRALKHQKIALKSRGIEYTTNVNDDYDILHINTVGLNSSAMINKARDNKKPVIYHAHSTEEDFRNSFVFSNKLSPIVKTRLISLYSQADYIITPTPYSKLLLESYGITQKIVAISNGIDLDRFVYDAEKVKAFYKYFSLSSNDKIIISVGLYFQRKGLLDFLDIARKLPDYTFIWFGYTNPLTIPRNMQDALNDYPDNVILPGYVKGSIIEGAYLASDIFFFPSYEETEGIVVLEALASKQNIILRDIPVFKPWLEDKRDCYMGNNNEEFIDLINKILNKEVADLSNQGYEVAKQKSLENIGSQLESIYNKVLNNENI